MGASLELLRYYSSVLLRQVYNSFNLIEGTELES